MEVAAVGKSYQSQVAATGQSTPATASLPDRPAKTEGAEQQAKAVEGRTGSAAPTLEQAKVDREQFEALLGKLNIILNPMEIQARFSVHEATKEIMVKVVNVETGELIREIPPERILDMFAKMEDMVGLLMDERG